jgi:hypothetical protein
MGGPAGSGGSDESDERKVDTYSDQHKKIEKRKSKYKTDKHGNIKKKNIIDTIADNHPVVQNVKNFADKHNLNKRMKYANKHGVNIQGLSTEEILSKDFKNKLDTATDGGYTESITAPRDDTPHEDGGQPKVASQMDNTGVKSDMITADKTSPTTVEMAALSEEEKQKRIKRKGRKTTILTGVTGVEDNPTLGKKTLLG